MLRRLLFLLVLGTAFHAAPALATPISVYGAWHCGNDFCTWGSVRDMTDFDVKNRWLVDRGSSRRSEEHTSELQSRSDLVCRLLLEKKKSQPTSDTLHV